MDVLLWALLPIYSCISHHLSPFSTTLLQLDVLFCSAWILRPPLDQSLSLQSLCMSNQWPHILSFAPAWQFHSENKYHPITWNCTFCDILPTRIWSFPQLTQTLNPKHVARMIVTYTWQASDIQKDIKYKVKSSDMVLKFSDTTNPHGEEEFSWLQIYNIKYEKAMIICFYHLMVLFVSYL